MQQVYRSLIPILRGHKSIKKVTYKYNYINIRYCNSIIEKWIFNRLVCKEIDVKFGAYNRVFALKEARWIDDVYDGKTVEKSYLYRLNDIEYSHEDISNYINWSYDKFNELKQVDKKLFVHEVIDYFVNHRYLWQKLPDNIIARDIEYLSKVDYKCHYYKDGVKIFKHRHLVEFGTLFFKNIIPTHLYDKLNIYLSFKKRSLYASFYSAINDLIDSNTTDPLPKDFNIDNIMLFYKTGDVELFKIMPITYYQAIIYKYDLTCRSFLDIDALWGEKSIAAVFCECDYYYVESCPFDGIANKIADYFGKRFIVDDGIMRYDFSIVDFGLKFNMEYFKYIIENYRPRIDMLIILVPLELDAEANSICKCDEKIAMYVNSKVYGYYFVYR